MGAITEQFFVQKVAQDIFGQILVQHRQTVMLIRRKELNIRKLEAPNRSLLGPGRQAALKKYQKHKQKIKIKN